MGEITTRVVVGQLADVLRRCRTDASRRALLNTAEVLGLNPRVILELARSLPRAERP